MAQKVEKQYYSISETSKITGVTQPCLRSWESEFPQLKPRRSSGGTRRYVQKDIDLILTIKNMMEHDGYTLSGVKDRLRSINMDQVTRYRQAVDRLLEIRAELIAIRRELNLTEALAQTVIVPGDNDPNKEY